VTNQVGAIANYTFAWHDGPLPTDPADGGSTGPTLSNKNGGSYTVLATHTPTGCVSSPGTGLVPNIQVLPVITSSMTASTNCTPALKNGQVAVTDVDGAGIGVPYIFKWYDGNVVVPGSEKALTAAYSNVQGGAARTILSS